MFNKLLIDQDKANHFVYGTLIASIVLSFTSPFYAIVATMLVAVAKEAYDSTGKGTQDGMDFVWTMFGCGTVILNEVVNAIF